MRPSGSLDRTSSSGRSRGWLAGARAQRLRRASAGTATHTHASPPLERRSRSSAHRGGGLLRELPDIRLWGSGASSIVEPHGTAMSPGPCASGSTAGARRCSAALALDALEAGLARGCAGPGRRRGAPGAPRSVVGAANSGSPGGGRSWTRSSWAWVCCAVFVCLTTSTFSPGSGMLIYASD